jgi:hypothetical protein
MASSVVKKRSDGKRPFRLLNLDKSLRAQKMMCDCPFLESCTQLTPSHSAATNAAISPLLLLPPEIRCRIYDYASEGLSSISALTTAHGSRFSFRHSASLRKPAHRCNFSIVIQRYSLAAKQACTNVQHSRLPQGLNASPFRYTCYKSVARSTTKQCLSLSLRRRSTSPLAA